jgi:hypothetical protein
MRQPDLQQILDHFHVGRVQMAVWADFGWMTNTTNGNFLIVDLGTPAQSVEAQEKLDDMVHKTYANAKLLLLPDYRGDIVVKVIHQQGHYFSVYQIEQP